jgi:hypothetical protein
MRQNEMLRMANQVRLRSFRTATKYMYGVEIPKDHRDAVRLDEINGNTEWQDCTKLEMGQLFDYKTFRDVDATSAYEYTSCMPSNTMDDTKHNSLHTDISLMYHWTVCTRESSP